MKSTYLLLCGLVITSCRGSRTPLNSYYAKVDRASVPVYKLVEAKQMVELRPVYVQPEQIVPAKEETKNVLSLTERGQQKYIEVLGTEYKGKPDEFIKNVAAPFKFSVPTVEESIIDKNEFHVKISLDIDDKLNEIYKANRIYNLRIGFRIKNEDLNFFKFDNIQTKYEVRDFGKETNTNARSFSMNAGADVAFGATANIFDSANNMTNTGTNAKTPTVGFGTTSTNTRVQEASTTGKVLTQYGTLSNKYASIYIESLPNTNLEGPLNIEFTIKSDALSEKRLVKFENLFTKNKSTGEEKPTSQDKVIIKPIFFELPKVSADMVVDIDYDFTYRKINKNAHTAPESDDYITFLYGEPQEKEEFKVLRKKDLKLKAYYIWDENKKMYLTIDKEPLGFATQQEANMFRKWVTESKSNKVRGRKMMLADKDNKLTELPAIDNLELIVMPVNLFEL